MNFLGVLSFNAPYLPWVLMGFTFLLHQVTPWADLMGLIVGHVYFYFEDVYPRLPGSNGVRFLRTPALVRMLLGGLDPNFNHDAQFQQEN